MKKYEWNEKEINLINNEDIACEDCRFRGATVATCIVYEELKPLSVLRGADCPKKQVKARGD